jgi:hypothetical protein
VYDGTVTDDSWQLPEAMRPPSTVTAELFMEWRAARSGTGNPERMTNPVWVWLARQPEINAYQAYKHFGGDTMGRGAGWTNQRFGQTLTVLPDGRTLAIGGEHEDSYDPDFWIYNDVIVTAPNGDVEIYGYVPTAFPPTDFHTATLVGDHIYLVGNLGYASSRKERTQLLRMHTGTLAVERVEAAGEDPGWISKHEATLNDDGSCITVTRGMCEIRRGEERFLRETSNDYRLDLTTLTWTRLTDRRWQQFELERADGRYGNLWDISQLADYVERPDDEFFMQQAARYRERLGREADLDAWRSRFQPPVPHEPLSSNDDDDWRVHRIRIDGTIVRYVDNHRGARVVIEGAVSASVVSAIIDDLRTKLSRADASPYVAVSLDDP